MFDLNKISDFVKNILERRLMLVAQFPNWAFLKNVRILEVLRIES